MIIGILYPAMSKFRGYNEITVFTRDFIQALQKFGIFSKCYIFVPPEEEKYMKHQLNYSSTRNRMSVENITEFISSADDFNVDVLYDMSTLHMECPYAPIHTLNAQAPIASIKLVWPHELNQLSLQMGSSFPTKLRFYDYLICLNAGLKMRVDWILERVKGRRFCPKSVYIPPGIDPETYQGDKEEARYHLQIPLEAKVILCLAHGNMDLIPLVRCFEELACRKTDIMLILGWRELGYATRIEKFLSDKPIRRRILLMENLDSFAIPLLYSAADIFVFPSDTLQQPYLPILEAMASGLPVIAPDWPGYQDIIQHGKTGYKVPILSANTQAELEKYFSLLPYEHGEFLISQSLAIDLKRMRFYLEQLLKDGNLRDSIGRSAKEFVLANHHWSQVIRKYEELWEIAVKEVRFSSDQMKDKAYPILTGSLSIPTIGLNSLIKRSTHGEKALESMEIHGYPEMSGVLYYPVVFEILSLIDSWTEISEILDYFNRISDLSRSFSSEILYHISWMIKQGFVELKRE